MAKAPGGAEFVPELIHNRSGVGSMIQTADLNKDGAVDIMAATSRGGHIFWNTARGGGRRTSPRCRRLRSEDPDAAIEDIQDRDPRGAGLQTAPNFPGCAIVELP